MSNRNSNYLARKRAKQKLKRRLIRRQPSSWLIVIPSYSLYRKLFDGDKIPFRVDFNFIVEGNPKTRIMSPQEYEKLVSVFLEHEKSRTGYFRVLYAQRTSTFKTNTKSWADIFESWQIFKTAGRLSKIRYHEEIFDGKYFVWGTVYDPTGDVGDWVLFSTR